MPVQDIGSWSAEDCLLDICLLVLSMLKLLVSSMLKDTGWWVGWNIANMQFVVLMSGDLESDENIDTA